MGCIYKITNLINGKIYIGLTTRTAIHRFNKHKSMLSRVGCSALYSAMRKYGKENFIIETLFISENKKELMKHEQFFICWYGSISPRGYNLTTGGEYCTVSDEVKEKMKKIMTGRKITWGDKVSKGVKKLWDDPEYRRKQTLQRHEKRGKYREGIVKLKLRRILDIQSIKKEYEDYNTVTEICKKHKISIPTLYEIIKREGIKKRGYLCNKQTA